MTDCASSVVVYFLPNDWLCHLQDHSFSHRKGPASIMLVIAKREAEKDVPYTTGSVYDHGCSGLPVPRVLAQLDAASHRTRVQDEMCGDDVDGDGDATLLQWPHPDYAVCSHAHQKTCVQSPSLLRSPSARTHTYRQSSFAPDAIYPPRSRRHDGSKPGRQGRPIKCICIVTKAGDDRLVIRTRELVSWLISVLCTDIVNADKTTSATREIYATSTDERDASVHLYVDSQLEHSPSFDAVDLLRAHPQTSKMLHYWTPHFCRTRARDLDLILTLGGDGTVLYTSRLFPEFVPPLLSFALGSLGFLTPFIFENGSVHGSAPNREKQYQREDAEQSQEEYRTTLTKILRDGARCLDERVRLDCTIVTADGTSLETFTVLNEVVFERGSSPCITALDLFLDGHLMTVVQADGLIISTPTGSTAYSMSAGGPLVHPSTRALLLTPICPHTLSFRPMVVPGTSVCTVRVNRDARGPVYMSLDGHERRCLTKGDAVRVSVSQHSLQVVASEPCEWTTSLCDKLQWNARPRQKPCQQTRIGDRCIIDQLASGQ